MHKVTPKCGIAEKWLPMVGRSHGLVGHWDFVKGKLEALSTEFVGKKSNTSVICNLFRCCCCSAQLHEQTTLQTVQIRHGISLRGCLSALLGADVRTCGISRRCPCLLGRLLLRPIVTQARPYCHLGQLLLRPMSLRPGLSTKMLLVTQANFLLRPSLNTKVLIVS